MNIGYIKEWAKAQGREVFTSNCDQIWWLINEVERMELSLSYTERLWREERQRNREEDEEERHL